MVTYRSPAKINLFLRVLNRRKDGYHEIATLLQAIDLYDYITIEMSTEDSLKTTNLDLPLDERNLVWKACRLFRQKTGSKARFSIYLDKKIPVEAGLGGGSSNAATTLFALNALTGSSYTDEELAEWSAEVGSDIPFFFSTGVAYCTGRGEKYRSLIPKYVSKYTVYKPSFGLSTPLVFNALQLEKCCQIDPEFLLEQFNVCKPFYINDLEEPAFAVQPRLKDLKELLLKQSSALMTGTGSSLFCVGETSISESDCSTYKTLSVQRQPSLWY